MQPSSRLTHGWTFSPYRDLVDQVGVRLAIDVGSVRIGVAQSDARGILAFPVNAVPAGEDSCARVATQAAECEAVEIIVGLPLGMNGSEGHAAGVARAWAEKLRNTVPIPIVFMDERLSSVQAQRGLHAAGRTTKTSRAVIDSAAAVVVLQAYLDARGNRAEGLST